MTGTEWDAVYNFEGNVKVDDVVRVAWSDIFESMVGRVVRVTKTHIDVSITEKCDHQYRLMRLPKVKHHTVWSWHNRVEPSNGYFFPIHPRYKNVPFSANEAGVRLVA